jgi:hypothetical protein
MCVPLMAVMVASAVVSAAGAYQQAQSQKAMLGAQAQQATHDAELSEAQARRESERGDRTAQQMGAQLADVKGKQAASLAASGVDISFGSAKATQEQTDYYGMQDQSTIARNATDADYALRDRARWGRAGATFTQGRANAISPEFAAGSSLLSSAGSVASKWYGGTGGGSKAVDVPYG